MSEVSEYIDGIFRTSAKSPEIHKAIFTRFEDILRSGESVGLLDKIKKLVTRNKNLIVLEEGVGVNALALREAKERLLSMGAQNVEAVGITANISLVIDNPGFTKGLTIVEGDVHNLDKLSQKDYDIIFSAGTYSHLVAPLLALESAVDHLRVGGILFVDGLPEVLVSMKSGGKEDSLNYLRSRLKKSGSHLTSSQEIEWSDVVLIERLKGGPIDFGLEYRMKASKNLPPKFEVFEKVV